MNSINQSAHFRNVDDLLFRGKNKAYGAYELRRDYDERLQRAFIYFILFTGFVSVSVGIYNFVQSKGHGGVLVSDPSPIVDSTIMTQIYEQPKPIELLQNTITHTAPVIVDKVNPREAEIEPVVAVINSDAQVGTTTNDAPISDVPISLNSQTGGGEVLSEDPIIISEIMPEFPGGEDAMIRFLQARVEFPDDLAAAGIKSGKCMLQFVVNEDGSISNITTLQKDDLLFSQEAIRVVRSMPRWKPGIQGGQKVKVYFELPFSFVMEN